MTLYLFTSSFPYGKGEQFLETEILYLSKKFTKIIITPTSYGNKPEMRKVPENVEVNKPILVSKIKRVFNFRHFFILKKSILFLSIHEFIRSINHNQVRLFLAALNIALYSIRDKNIQKILNESRKEDVLYFYWGNDLSFIIPFMQQNIHAKIIFRLHRSDLYEYLYNDYFPFREEQIAKADYIIPISEDGKKYLDAKYSKYKEKIIVHKLGTKNHNNLVPKNNNEYFRIVSCSSLIEEKRVDLIIDILSNIKNLNIEWVHFGDGYLKNQIFYKLKKLSSNIEVDFKGFVANKDILEYYKLNTVDLFINVSSNEGIPVSIMEAISFGIPVIATKVGGTGEIVSDDVGILLDENFDILNTSNIIKKIINKEIEFDSILIKEFWSKNYDANKNYDLFTKFLIGS